MNYISLDEYKKAWVFRHKDMPISSEDAAQIKPMSAERAAVLWTTMVSREHDHPDFFDKTDLDVVDVAGNVYNRLVIFNARAIHSASEYFGDTKENAFKLSINIDQKKTKTSVESNQAASMIRYELQFNYTLISIENDCVTFQKELLSSFSIIPKSSGYNYGTDASLEKKYELAIIENLDRFISILSDININTCK